MVVLSNVILNVKKLPRKYLRGKFLDSLRLHVKGGSGGSGAPKYGGVGGQGGCVYCIGKEGAKLERIVSKNPTKKFAAGNGEDSTKTKLIGAPGSDIQIEVPLGITIIKEDGSQMGSVNEEGKAFILARGGPGGNSNNGFLGHAGQNHTVRLDLKLIADVGLVGFPNAGKSSFLKAISRAKPKIANYPFTTIRPNLGTILYPDLRQITIADLPGLIEGAHINIGLGHKFLKHVERTKILLLIVDINGFALSFKYAKRNCLETIMLLNKELELYNREILDKPAILAINKIDTENGEQKFLEIKDHVLNINKAAEKISKELMPEKILQFEDIIGISALKGDNIEQIKHVLRLRLDEHAERTNPDILDATELLSRHRGKIRERGPRIT